MIRNPQRFVYEWPLKKRKTFRFPRLPAGKYRLYWWDKKGSFSSFKPGKILRGALFLVRLERKKKPPKKRPKVKVKRLTEAQKRAVARKRSEDRKRRLLEVAAGLNSELTKQLNLLKKRPDLRDRVADAVERIREKVKTTRKRKGGTLKPVREALDAILERAKEIEKEVEIPEPSPDWYPADQFVQGFIRKFGVPPSAWQEEARRITKIPGAQKPELIYSPLKLMYHRELSKKEMGESKSTTSYFFWAICRVSRELDPYISDGHLTVSPAAEGIRMPAPKHSGKRISTKDRVVLLGCPFTWKAIRGEVRITPKYFYEFLFTIHEAEPDKPFSGQEVWKSVMQSYFTAKHSIYVHPLDDGFVGFIPRDLV